MGVKDTHKLVPVALGPIAPRSRYGILWVIFFCSFKNSPLFPICVNWLENLTKLTLLSTSSIPGWTFDDKCYLAGQKGVWTYPGGVIITPMRVYAIYSAWFVPLKTLFPIFVNWLGKLTEWRLLSISSIPGWTFDDKCYLGGQNWLWPCPIGVMLHARLLHSCMYGFLWVICSFKCLALALFFIFFIDLIILTEWRLLSISSIPGWTFDDKCYLGGQKWHWTCPGGFLLQPRHLYTVYCGWCVPLKIHRYFPFLLIDMKISQNEDYCLSHRSRSGHLMTNVI